MGGFAGDVHDGVVAVDDPLSDGQAEARALGVHAARRARAVEALERHADVVGRHADAGVAHLHDHLPLRRAAQAHVHAAALAGVQQRVLHEDGEQLFDALGIAHDARARVDGGLQANVPIARDLRHVLAHPRKRRAQRHVLVNDLVAVRVGARHGEQGRQHGVHLLGAVEHGLEPRLLLLHRVLGVAHDHLDVRLRHGKRVLQLVRRVCRELTLLAPCLVNGHDGALRHAVAHRHDDGQAQQQAQRAGQAQLVLHGDIARNVAEQDDVVRVVVAVALLDGEVARSAMHAVVLAVHDFGGVAFA